MWKEKKDETFTRAVRTINYIRAIALSLWKNCKLFFKDAKCLSKYSQNTISCMFSAKHLSRVQFLSSETEDANRTIQTNKSSVKWRWLMKSQNEGNMSGGPKNKNQKGRTRRDAFSNEEHLNSFGRLERRLWKFLEQKCHGRSQRWGGLLSCCYLKTAGVERVRDESKSKECRGHFILLCYQILLLEQC